MCGDFVIAECGIATQSAVSGGQKRGEGISFSDYEVFKIVFNPY